MSRRKDIPHCQHRVEYFHWCVSVAIAESIVHCHYHMVTFKVAFEARGKQGLSQHLEQMPPQQVWRITRMHSSFVLASLLVGLFLNDVMS